MGGVTEVGLYSSNGFSQRVYWFHADDKRMGDYSPFGTILLNERVSGKFTQDAVDYVFLHEMGHHRMNTLVRLLFWPGYMITGLFAFVGVMVFPRTLSQAIEIAPSLFALPGYLAVALGVTFATVIPFILVSWLDEALAELFAISIISVSQYRAVREEFRNESEAGILRKVRIRIQYPPESLILWIARNRGAAIE